jgi:hypothetical protein
VRAEEEEAGFLAELAEEEAACLQLPGSESEA